MATRASLAGREAEAQKRIDAAAAMLADQHGIDPPVVPFERKPDHRMALFLETHADFYEALAGDKAKAAPTIAAPNDVTLGAEVTEDGTPVVVTEAIDGDPKPAAKKGKA